MCTYRYAYPIIAKKEELPEVALEEFKKIVTTEEEKGDWYAHMFGYI